VLNELIGAKLVNVCGIYAKIMENSKLIETKEKITVTWLEHSDSAVIDQQFKTIDSLMVQLLLKETISSVSPKIK
jgi:hypothetical protein